MAVRYMYVCSTVAHLWLECDSHVTCESSRHAAWRVEINLEKVFEVVRCSNETAVVDAVGDVCQLKFLPIDLAHFKVTEDHFFWLTEKSLALLSE